MIRKSDQCSLTEYSRAWALVLQGRLGPWLEKVLQHHTPDRPVLQTTVILPRQQLFSVKLEFEDFDVPSAKSYDLKSRKYYS